jgi:hypothetical protein
LYVQLKDTLCPTTTTTTTLPCDTVPLESFAGKTYEVSQESTAHGNAEYTYIIAVGGSIKQLTHSSGNFTLGVHKSYTGTTEDFGDGDMCGDVPRSATVSYTFGAKTELLRAAEISMCKYEFDIQLPHAIDAFAGRTYSITQKSTLHGTPTYTYNVEVGGKIEQSTSDTHETYTLGTHASYNGAEEKFTDGDSCGGGKRSATVTYTYGTEAKIISADEPETCVYDFKIQLPQNDCR